MPNRYVRDALLASSAWVSLPDDGTRLLFVRLILLADDFGVYDGRPEVIANHAYPTELWDAERVAQLKEQLDHLHRAGMIIRFANRGRPYIGIPQWGNDLKGDRRFPAPPIDLDLETINSRGKYGQPIGWENPPGSDPVSILLDVNGQAVVPQPREWRMPYQLMPKRKRGKKGAVVTSGVESDAASDKPLVTTTLNGGGLSTGGNGAASDEPLEKEKEKEMEIELDGVVAAVEPHARAREPLVTEPPNNGGGNGNGKICFEREAGAFIGLTDALQAHWQSMFSFPIPDQLDRAGAWLRANKAEADAIEREGEGYESFLVRWLLREARTHARTHGT